MDAKKPAPTTFEEYLADIKPDFRQSADHLRTLIETNAPGAEKRISYQLPCYYLHGKPLIGFGVFKDHLSLFPMGSSAIDRFREELGHHVTGKGTIQFTPDDPLPDDLVVELIRSRVAAVEARTKKKSSGN